MAGAPHGVFGGIPVGDLPSPPPWGWSRGFITTPRTSGRWPMWRARPALGQEHVSLLTIAVVQQPVPGGPVRVVLDRGDPGRHTGLVALEVDPAVVGLLAAAAMAHGEATLVVPAGGALLRFEERLVGLGGRDLLERRAGHPATA